MNVYFQSAIHTSVQVCIDKCIIDLISHNSIQQYFRLQRKNGYSGTHSSSPVRHHAGVMKIGPCLVLSKGNEE